MTKIVNGEVVDPESGAVSGSSSSSISIVRRLSNAINRLLRGTINILGLSVPVPAAFVGSLLSIFWFGATGGFLFAAVAIISHFVFGPNRDRRGEARRGRLNPGRSNIRGMNDLPKPPPSS